MAETRTIADQVESQVGLVLRKWDQAKVGLEMQGTDAAKTYIGGLRSFKPGVDSWAQRGRDGAAAGKKPRRSDGTEGSWEGWSNAGTEYLKGIKQQYDDGSTETVRILEEIVREAPAEAKKVIKKTAKAAGEIVGAAVGEVAKSGGTQFAWGVALPIVLGAGAVLTLLFVARKSVVG